MKPRISITEVLVIICVLAVLAALILPASNNWRDHKGQIYCLMNVRKIGVADSIWAGDHGEKFPMEVSVTNGGVMELAATGNAAACYQVLSHGLGSPTFLICPKDTIHTAAPDFQNGFNNSHISYFVGLDATIHHPEKSILSGDANLAIDGVPVNSGLLELSSNAPVAWTKARHSYGGGLGFADGHAVEAHNPELQSSLQLTLLATNRFAIP